MKAAIGGAAVPGQISVLYSAIRPAVDEAGPDLEATSKANGQYHARYCARLPRSLPVC